MMRLVSLIVLLAAAGAVTAPELLRQAREAFAAQRYAEALDLYDQLRRLHPQQARIPYNMGVAAYRQGDLARAAELFDQARMLAGDPALRAKSAYNLGTTAYRKSLEQPQDPARAASQLGDATGDLEQALEHFREAIDADPGDLDAKANGELAYRWLEQLRQMQEQMQQQQQQQQQGQDQERQEQPQQGQQRQDQEQQEQQQDQPEQEQPQPQEQPQQAEGQEQQVASDERDEADERKPMSRAEAQRLLQQVRDKERQRQEELARREAGRRPPVDKDW
jgi:tetratricopeptide (TPR) repeat protein